MNTMSLLSSMLTIFTITSMRPYKQLENILLEIPDVDGEKLAINLFTALYYKRNSNSTF